MKRRLGAFALGGVLAACAAVTGLDHFVIGEDPADGGGTVIGPDGATVVVLPDGAIVPINPDGGHPIGPASNGTVCTATLSCDAGSVCCYATNGQGYGTPSCASASECVGDGGTTILLPFACDENADCTPTPGQVCCVRVYETKNTTTGKTGRASVGSNCVPAEKCENDAGSGTIGTTVTSFFDRVSCLDGGTCQHGSCTPFFYDGGDGPPKLQDYCGF